MTRYRLLSKHLQKVTDRSFLFTNSHVHFFFWHKMCLETTVINGFNSSLERILQNTLINNAGRLILTGEKKKPDNKQFLFSILHKCVVMKN